MATIMLSESNSSDSDTNSSPPRKRKKTKTVDQKFKEQYSVQFPLITKSRASSTRAHCTACNTDFSIAHSGIYDIKKHIATGVHQRNATCVSKQGNISRMFNKTQVESVTRAEILFVNFLTEHNLSLASADHSGPLFRAMFPDSKIAAKVSIFLEKFYFKPSMQITKLLLNMIIFSANVLQLLQVNTVCYER